MTTRLPSIAQMVNRANDGHHKAVLAYLEGLLES